MRQPIRPNYNMKNVLKKLPELSENEPLRAKRLLLGLHERLWHCPAQDLRNLLLRAGQTRGGEPMRCMPEVHPIA